MRTLHFINFSDFGKLIWNGFSENLLKRSILIKAENSAGATLVDKVEISLEFKM